MTRAKRFWWLKRPRSGRFPVHEPRPGWSFNDAKNMVGFADGHVSYIKMYWNTNYYLSGCRV